MLYYFSMDDDDFLFAEDSWEVAWNNADVEVAGDVATLFEEDVRSCLLLFLKVMYMLCLINVMSMVDDCP